MKSRKVNYAVIPSIELFYQSLFKRGELVIKEREPSYYSRFQACITLHLKPKEVHESCDSLLKGNLDKFIALIESLYEVRYYWKRFYEVFKILESNPATQEKITNAQWFIYNLDYLWHVQYSLEERLLTFLKRLKRYYNQPGDIEITKLIDSFLNVVNTSEKGTKLMRHPITHERSAGVVGWRNSHDWESSFASGDYSDLIDIYDERMLHDKEFYMGYIRKWMGEREQGMEAMFQGLLAIPLDRVK